MNLSERSNLHDDDQQEEAPGVLSRFFRNASHMLIAEHVSWRIQSPPNAPTERTGLLSVQGQHSLPQKFVGEDEESVETPALIRHSLAELDREWAAIRLVDSSRADPLMRLACLRAEGFHTKAAALRLATFSQVTMVSRKQDETRFNDWIQVLSQTDRKGRTIVSVQVPLRIDDLQRAWWSTVMSLVPNVTVQRRGIVVVVAPLAFDDRQQQQLLQRLLWECGCFLRQVPLRIVAVHIFLPSSCAPVQIATVETYYSWVESSVTSWLWSRNRATTNTSSDPESSARAKSIHHVPKVHVYSQSPTEYRYNLLRIHGIPVQELDWE